MTTAIEPSRERLSWLSWARLSKRPLSTLRPSRSSARADSSVSTNACLGAPLPRRTGLISGRAGYRRTERVPAEKGTIGSCVWWMRCASSTRQESLNSIAMAGRGIVNPRPSPGPTPARVYPSPGPPEDRDGAPICRCAGPATPPRRRTRPDSRTARRPESSAATR